ncbi:hypothetical protein [Paraburkholderia hospita]|uniref:hypothetical protein n=1 Tax=Paraburkholderia hospita TaxID=169430 RepID=UPI0009A5CB85|nr:hypothetical protein [Paraburkholderia hospita]AXF00178.1 hypothetical protein CUJ88_05975 [Paraburkholderia hospita]OUL71928.1 hypothetical protein CA601_46205 [Paraburkholderia hospita]OUL76556.1 hypothetical protein CA603_37885 [Paraburkholderia hospita]SKC73732.1 hypothetical protein SAMN05445504_1653 [Burkholderia sp. CF099]
MNAPSLFQPVRRIAALALVAGAMALSGCMLDPPGPSPIYSRLPADQSGIAATAQPLTPEERARYDAIDKQVMAEQNQAMAADAAAQAYSRYAAPPVSVYGSYYSGGWGHGWGTGIGYGYAPGWGW